MPEYTVQWTLHVDAAYPKAAAQVALTIQRDPESTATVFLVEDPATGQRWNIDLDDTAVHAENLATRHAWRKAVAQGDTWLGYEAWLLEPR